MARSGRTAPGLGRTAGAGQPPTSRAPLDEHGRDALARVPVPERRPVTGPLLRTGQRRVHGGPQRVRLDEPVGAGRDRDGPLRVGAQRQAGDVEDRGLLLDAAAVGDDGGRPATSDRNSR